MRNTNNSANFGAGGGGFHLLTKNASSEMYLQNQSDSNQ